MDEFDALGRDAFLEKYGYGKATQYFLVRNGKYYDSKAIAGVAHGYEHPELGPLLSNKVHGGFGGAKTKLEELGFEITVSPVPEEISVWLVRAGERGQAEALNFEQGVVSIGWAELPDVAGVATIEEMRELYSEIYPDTTANVSTQARQVFLFAHELAVGDYVLTPLKSRRGYVAVGRVAGPYAYRLETPFIPEGQHTHPVEWLSRGTPV